MSHNDHRWQAEEVCCPILELRQYTLHPGKRDVLIDLFDHEFVESQEAVGMCIVGQFRDQDDPDRFVWIRGFQDMDSRADALAAFYGGPVWKAHSKEANATMIDSSNVLLLRPTDSRSGFSLQYAIRPPVGASAPPSSLVVATLYHRATSVDDEFVQLFDRNVRPAMAETAAPPVARLQSEAAENTFPALPVRTGENVFAWFSSFTGPDHFRDHTRRLARSTRWNQEVLPELLTRLSAVPQQLRLAPTARSLLR